MPESDADLLNAFAARRDEAAFRVLAGRHLGLVFHAALRRTGSRPLAEEISQNVLCALAAKAGSLARHPERLPAWLHRATLYESTKAMRSEASRRRREQLADPPGQSGQEPALLDALPYLDPALDRLGEADRRLLLLHYYEGRSFPDIAGLLGKSTVAVQKQSQRALEKLARMLRGRGVALSVAGLASLLSCEFAKAASPSLISSAVATALTGSGGTSTGLVLFMAMKSKALVPAALLIAVIPLALLEVAISRAEQRNESLRAQSSSAVAAAHPSAAFARGGSSISTSIDLLVLINEQAVARRGGEGMWDEFMAKLAALDRETLRRLTKETVVFPTRIREKGLLLESLVEAMTRMDPEFSVKTAMDALEASASVSTLWSYSHVPQAFGAWAWRDPGSAWAWMKEQEKTGLLRPGRMGPSDFPADELKAQLLWTLMVRKHALASEFIDSIGEPVGRGAESILDRSLRLIPPPGSELVAADHAWVEVYLEAIHERVPEARHRSLHQAVVSRFRVEQPGSLENLKPLFQNPAITAEERESLVREVIVARSSIKHYPADPEADRRVADETLAWLNDVLPDEKAKELVDQVSRERWEGERQRVQYQLEAIRLSGSSDEGRAQQLRDGNFGEWIGDAIELAKAIQDPELRDKTIRHLEAKANSNASEK
jgi:RNA polymerase sigma factor (sigma-70 family)